LYTVSLRSKLCCDLCDSLQKSVQRLCCDSTAKCTNHYNSLFHTQPRRHTFCPLSAGHISLSSAFAAFVLEVSFSHMFSAINLMFSAYVLAAALAICYLHKTQNIQVSQQNIPSVSFTCPLSLPLSATSISSKIL